MQTTRRESLGLFGVGLAALTGCGGAAEVNSGGGSGSGGMAGDGSSGAGAAPGEGGGGPSSAGSGTVEGGASGSAGTGGSDAGAPGDASGAGAGGEGGTGSDAACVAKNEATAGPYPNLTLLERRDIRGNTTGVTTPKDGAELVLRLKVMDLDSLCSPIEGAVVDIWQCDAQGVYASYEPFGTVGQDFLRGYQKTDAQGVAEFLTIFPGSYSGRSIHIHFSIRNAPGVLVQNANGNSLPSIFVAQLYFYDPDSYAIFEEYPAYQGGAPITPNGLDGIFNLGGTDLKVPLSKSLTGLVGEVTIGVSRAGIGM